jgi:RNA polymerase sigma-70 factor (ECF subfamily)
LNEPDVTMRRPDEVRVQALMLRYQCGDAGAFDELYPLLLPVVRGILRRQGPDRERLADLVQETFLQIHRARHTYDARYPVMPWVTAIARHVYLMHRRAAARRPQPTSQVEDLPLAVRADAESYAGAADLRAALGGLSPARRRPVLWHHVWGLSFREIARRLRIGEDAAKLRSSRGMADLRSALTARHTGAKNADD